MRVKFEVPPARYDETIIVTVDCASLEVVAEYWRPSEDGSPEGTIKWAKPLKPYAKTPSEKPSEKSDFFTSEMVLACFKEALERLKADGDEDPLDDDHTHLEFRINKSGSWSASIWHKSGGSFHCEHLGGL